MAGSVERSHLLPTQREGIGADPKVGLGMMFRVRVNETTEPTALMLSALKVTSHRG